MQYEVKNRRKTENLYRKFPILVYSLLSSIDIFLLRKQTFKLLSGIALKHGCCVAIVVDDDNNLEGVLKKNLIKNYWDELFGCYM